MKICSKIVDIHTDQELIKSLKCQWYWLEWPQKAYITYIDGQQPIALAGRDIPDEVDSKFEELLPFLINSNLHNNIVKIAVGITAYHQAINQNKSPQYLINLAANFKPISIVDDILSSSGGIIIWQYQLVSLLNIFYYDHGYCQSMMKKINRKELTAFDKIRKIMVNDRLSLCDLIESRMLLGNVFNPDYYRAARCYQVIHNDNEVSIW